MDGESSSVRHNKLENILHDQSSEPRSLPLKDLKEITNYFSEELLLGQGGFGKVYKGVLRNGDMIAVKKLTWTTTGIQDKQYENEARHLMRLKHPNIVQLVGYCSETETELVLHKGKYVCAEKSERLLCLEYLPNGSLCTHLSDESCGLDWDTRYRIIKGICFGLHYLHEEWQASTPIIHRDLKPANILLDHNMVPKIADFGLSRLFGELQTRTITKNQYGTLGYMSPEYLNRGIITKALDIFSLGVIIIQIVTGDRSYPDNVETSPYDFIELVVKRWRNRRADKQGYASREFDCQQIRSCIMIGLLCVKLDRAERPTTHQIIEMLAWGDEKCGNEGEIPEEVNKAHTNFSSFRAPSLCRTLVDQNSPLRYKLTFMNGLSYGVYTKNVISAADGEPLKIRMVVDGPQGTIPHRLLSAKVKIVVLDGDFNRHNQEGWVSEKFSNYIIRPRDKVGAILTGVSELTLNNGEAYLHGVSFVDNSKFVRSGQFKLGAMVYEEELCGRVQEGITEPFFVKDRRGKGCQKHDIPSLNDDVWRLKRIPKGGVLHKELIHHGIFYVKDLLRLYYKDEQALRKILTRASELVWNTIIEHAKKCDPGKELYSVCQIVGATYNLDKSGKGVGLMFIDLVEQFSKYAYKNMTYDKPDYETENCKPRPINLMLEHRFTNLMQGHIEGNICQTDDQEGNSGSNNLKQCKIKRHGSVRVTQNTEDASLDYTVFLDSSSDEQYCAGTSAEDVTGSVTLHCPATAANVTTGASLTTDHEEEEYGIPLIDNSM